MGNELIYYKSLVLETDSTPDLTAGTGDSLDNDLILDETENFLLLEVTELQYLRMLSALWNGAYTTYPDDFIAVVYPLIKAGKVPLCDAILDCIETTPAIQNAIGAFSVTTPIASDATELTENLDTQLIDDPIGCDNDIIYGMCVGLANLLNRISEDMLQIFIQAASPAGRIGDIIEALPAIGILPVDDIFQFVEAVMDDINSSYAAAYTAQVAEDIACGFFCIAQENCELDMEQARDWILGELTASVSFTNWTTFISDVIADTYSGVQTVWIMHMIILEAIIFGGNIVGFDINRIATTILAMLNDPDGDWSTLCTTCAFSETWLGGSGDPEADKWVIDLGTYNAGNDDITEGVRTGSTNGATIRLTVTAGLSGFIDQIVMGYDVDTNSQRTQRIRMFDVGDNLIFEENVDVTGTDIDLLVWNGHQAFVATDYFLLTTARSTPVAGHATMTDIGVQGSGDNPFV